MNRFEDKTLVSTTIESELLATLPSEEFEITIDENGTVTVFTDEWTLELVLDHVPHAWLALDDEPDDPAALEAERERAMPPSVVKAISRADTTLGGLLRSALSRSPDRLSQLFAHALDDDLSSNTERGQGVS
jgi:hypothetical protein